MNIKTWAEKAFARAEALAILAGVGLLASLAVPLWGGATRHSEVAACANNLRQIGQGMRLWAHDHGGQMPWRVLQSEGGTMPQAGNKTGAAWFEWASFDDEIPSPTVLVCPSDTKRRAARFWTNDPDGGLFNANYRNNSVSYFVAPDTFSEAGFAPLAGDRNLSVDNGRSGCSARLGNVYGIWSNPFITSQARWTNGIHRTVGNVLLNDGTVEVTSTTRFHELIQMDIYDNGSWHILFP